jgi:hypothetical protein
MNREHFLPCFCYQTKDFYIITLPKVASSWLFDLTHTYPEIMDIDSKDEFWASLLIFNQINLSISQGDETSSYNFNDLQDDWYKLIHGNNQITRNFIFLMRNPVTKFVSGTMQDILYQNKENPGTDPLNMISAEFLQHFVDYPHPIHFEKIKLLNDKYSDSERNTHWWTLDGKWWNDTDLIDVINYWIRKKLHEFFKKGFNVRDYKSDHNASNIYLYHKILFNSNIDITKVKILDIERENIYDYLIGKYNLGDANSDVSYKEERNKTGRIFKNLIIKNIREYTDIIEIVLKEDILMYIDVYKKIYDIDLTYDDVFRQLK